MCAVFGWLDYEGKVPYRTLKKLTRHLANAAQERGTDASGISYIQNKKVVICKAPRPAKKLKINFPQNTRAIMGHTRLTTQGSEKLNYNNHPFYGKADKSFALAHNGVLYNDTQLRKSHNLPKTMIETDSYVAVQLIEKKNALNAEVLKNVAEDVYGSFVFTLLDENNKLYIVKGSNPLYLIHLSEVGLYIYASTPSIVNKALRHSGLHNEAHTVISLDEGEIIEIDNNGVLSRANFNHCIYSSLIPYRTSLYEDWYTDEKNLMLSMCGCFGIDREELNLLFDYGYTEEEIEYLLSDRDALYKTIYELKYETTANVLHDI